jgi:hypothetical protein
MRFILKNAKRIKRSRMINFLIKDKNKSLMINVFKLSRRKRVFRIQN